MIPEYLKNFNHWVCWQYETRPTGKKTKVPKTVTGHNAASDNPATWASYDDAVNARQAHNFDGIGFMLNSKIAPIVGLDLDHCINGNGLEPWAKEIVTRVNSYTEITPSGTGLRIFALGSLPATGRKKGNIELYEDGRFLTVTGNALEGTPLTIENRPDEIREVHTKIFGAKPDTSTTTQTAQPNTVDDEKLLEIMFNAGNGPDIEQLWRYGNYPAGWSQSEADLSLCNHLAFYTGRDEQRVDSLFRQSALMREKWDEKHYADGQTYGQATIAKAINGTQNVFSGNGKMAEIEEIEASYSTWADLQEIIGPIEWDWSRWLARGFQTMVAAYSGQGKSNLILHIARVFATGCPWPDGTDFTGDPGKILWIETESAQALNLERAEKWGLPLDRIVTPLSNPLDNASLDDNQHQARIVALARLPEIKLIIVDSLSGGTRKNASQSNDMLDVGGFLAELAKTTNKAVLVSHHLKKPDRNLAQDTVTLDRVRDSSSIVQLARTVWAIDTPDIEQPDSKRLYCIKSNLAKFPQPLGFEVTDNGLIFGDAPQPARQESQFDRAIDLLKAILSNGPAQYEVIEQSANKYEISMDTMRRAKKKMGLVSVKSSTGPWLWQHPQNEEFIV